MKLSHLICLTFFIIALLFVGLRHYISQAIENYAQTTAQQTFGNLALSPEKEATIRALAEEMEITTPFMVRRMNRTSLLTYGYHNAFVCFPQLFCCIPISNTPFLFISEEFFEDLSKEEQRFLIGHELTHLQEHHTQYLNLVMIIIILAIASFFPFMRKHFSFFVEKQGAQRYKTPVTLLLLFLIATTFFTARNLGTLYYRRHMERVADYASLTKLKSYDGALALINRWQKEFNLPLHNPYYGLLSDHPSSHERKTYCLHLKNKSKDTV